MGGLHTLVAEHAMLISALILAVVYIFIIIEKISKVTVALLGASFTILVGLISQHRGLDSVNPFYFINFIDFNVIFLLVAMMIIVNITAKSGVFKWFAIELLKKTKGQPVLILVTLAIFTAIASAFLDNVTTVILVMPVTL
jgi:Na+/H+ antiporter NhaD/arsenite permease-like protein